MIYPRQTEQNLLGNTSSISYCYLPIITYFIPPEATGYCSFHFSDNAALNPSLSFGFGSPLPNIISL